MPTTLTDLPTELWLSILRHIDAQHLYQSVRRVDRRSRSCVDDIYRNEILPSFWVSLLVFLESEYPLRPGGDVQLVFSFQQIIRTKDGAELAEWVVTSADPAVRKQRALARWKDPEASHAFKDPLMLRVTLPPHFLVTLQGRAWQDCVYEDSSVALGRSDARVLEDRLLLDWRKLVAIYFRKSSALERIADQRDATIGSRFPMY